MSYLHPDGQPDTVDELTTSGRCFARGLGHLLKDREGICIELIFQPNFPNDAVGKFMVYKKDSLIVIETLDSTSELEDGQMVWIDEP